VSINIVNPYGVISLVDAPFTRCGNRGRIDDGSHVTRSFEHRRWIYCVTSALRDPDEFMNGRTFTDLFFLDEATALAAGHRPCHQCNRSRADEFDAAWKVATRSTTLKVDAMDQQLNEERINKATEKVSFRATGSELSAGTIVKLEEKPFLLTEDLAYGVPRKRPVGDVEVLTPLSTVRALQTKIFEVSLESLVMRWPSAD
jgi:hypothetical protein